MRVCPECERKTADLICPRDGTPTIDEALLKEASDPLIGRVLAGRYRVLESLGQGAMGRVYVADQMTMKRRVALKVIRAETLGLLAERLDVIRRFRREAMAASRLKHPNTVQVHDHGTTEDGILFLVMELVEGRSLAAVLRHEGRLRPERAVRIGVQVCRSLAEAHEAGIVHRDLKPENIMLTRMVGEQDFVKVLDFGIAKIALPGTGKSAMTQGGVVLGTPTYMAPEQALEDEVGPATDLYALGVVLYQCLSGRLPFEAQTPLAVMMKQAHDPVPPLVRDGSPPDVPPALESLVYSLLAKRPEDRPGPALQVAALLEASLGRSVRPVETQEDDTTVKWPSGDSRDTAALALQESRWRQVRRRLAWVGIGAVALAGMVAAMVGLGGTGDAGGSGTAPGGGVDAVTATDAPVGTAGSQVEDAREDQTAARDAIPGTGQGRDAGVAQDPGRTGRAEEARPSRTPPAPPRRLAPSPPPRRLPACQTLRCPFIQECVGPDGKRTTGSLWCPPVF